jgi:alpha,alpha-trehalase
MVSETARNANVFEMNSQELNSGRDARVLKIHTPKRDTGTPTPIEFKFTVAITKTLFDAVIFDLDGVVTRTARVHAAAWKQLFDNYREERLRRGLPEYEPFDVDHDYRLFVDGKPRYDGIQSFLEARGIEIPYGQPDDPPDQETVCGLGNRKNLLFHQHLERDGVQVYDSTVRLIRELRENGFKVAIISASKNCSAVLQAARIQDLFHAQVDGVVATDLGLKGKPAPDVFLEAAQRIGVTPARSVVVEDAVAGVEAGRRGGFALVIGVDRTGKPERLMERGAQLVVSDLAEVGVARDTASPNANTADLPSALDHVEQILASRLQRLAVFLDYDGTLTPIVAHPEDAVLSEAMRETVRQLAKHRTVGIISGRDLADVRNLVGLEELVYAGSHGFEIAGPLDFHHTHEEAEDCRLAIDQAESLLRKDLTSIPGVQVERKRYAIAVHYRNARDEQIPDVERVVDEVASQHDNLRKSGGKKIFELQPRLDWNKGRALGWLLTTLKLDGPEILPLYIGDDLTDEDAFAALRERGVGIVVRDEPRPTAARYALDDVAGVKAFLDQVLTHAQ